MPRRPPVIPLAIPLGISLVCSIAYFGMPLWGRLPAHWLVKALSIAVLAWLVRRSPLLVTAMLCGALGDALLSLGRHWFVHGLAAFLCGHLAYTAAFLRLPGRTPHRAALLALAVYGTVLYALLWPGLGPMRAPVALYTAAIVAMGMASLRLGGMVTVGALLFLLSDTILAIHRFRAHVPFSGQLVWMTYYGGQLLLALGCARQVGRTQP